MTITRTDFNDVYTILFETLNHHGIYGSDIDSYAECAQSALSLIQEDLANKTFDTKLISQVIQSVLRESEIKSKIKHYKMLSPRVTGKIIGEQVVKDMRSVKTLLEDSTQISIPSSRAIPLINLPHKVEKKVTEQLPKVLSTITNNMYEMEKIPSLVSAYDLDGSDGSHWIVEIVGRGRVPYHGYVVTMTNPRGYISEAGIGDISGNSYPVFNTVKLLEAVDRVLPTDYVYYTVSDALMELEEDDDESYEGGPHIEPDADDYYANMPRKRKRKTKRIRESVSRKSRSHNKKTRKKKVHRSKRKSSVVTTGNSADIKKLLSIAKSYGK